MRVQFAQSIGQRRGARLFFTSAEHGGAGCFSCHSGPMFNKQPNDPDVAGIGKFVEENFFNVGIGDHPVLALNALQRGIGTAYLLERVGTTQEVLIQGEAKRGQGLVSGWTEQRETVVLPGDRGLVGEIVPVRISGLSGITLHGEIDRPDARGREKLLELAVVEARA